MKRLRRRYKQLNMYQWLEYVSMADLYHGVGRLRYSIDAI